MSLNKYRIVYEDASILIVDKIQGLATGFGEKESLCGFIFNDYPQLKLVRGFKEEEAGLLNRLDNETGGLVLFAKSDDSFRYYSNELKSEKIIKTYYAWVEGILKKERGTIILPVAHHLKNKKKMIIVKDSKFRGKGQEAKTEYIVLKNDNDKSFLELKITKGRRHQIRVHLAEIGHPIIGDKLYNKKKYPDKLHHLLYSIGLDFIPYQAGERITLKIDPFFDIDFH